MYSIYTDDKLLYAPHLFHEGYGALSPKLTVELNKAGSLEFTLPPNNVQYDGMRKMKSIITAFQNDEELFRGRVLHDEKDFYKRKSTYCEGDLAFLLDSVQRPYTVTNMDVSTLFKQYITNHNSKVSADKQFTVGKVTVTGKITCESYDYSNTLDEINNQIIDVLGGYLQTRKTNGTHYIDLLAYPEVGAASTTNQIIEFGVNMLDITEYITAEDIFTVLIPLGATIQNEEETTNEKLTIASVNNGKDYIEDTSAISLFGRIERTVNYSEVESASELLELGRNLLNECVEMAMSLTVKAVDLHTLDVNTELIRLGDLVRVISVPHGLDTTFQCTKIVYDFEDPGNNEYSFGLDYSSMTEQQLNDKKTMKSSVSMVLLTAGAVNASVSKVNEARQEVENIVTDLPTAIPHSDVVTIWSSQFGV